MAIVREQKDYVARSYKKHLEDGRLIARDVAIIKEYINEKLGQGQISQVRAQAIIFALINWRKFIKAPYDQITLGDVFEALQEMPKALTERGTLPSQNTIETKIRILKPFLLWMNEAGYTNLNEKKIRGIKGPGVDLDTKRPEDLIKFEEITTLINTAHSVRDKAFIAVLYESGARVSEISSLKWKDITFDDSGASITIDDTKNKKTRFVKICTLVHYLAHHRENCHPCNPDTNVFLDRNGNMLSYFTIRKLVGRAKEKTGITKRVHPHLFRSSRITHMVSDDFHESILKEAMWGNINTNMLRVYLKLDKTDIENEYLKHAGIEIPEEKKKASTKPIRCYNCNSLMPPQAKYCYDCGKHLTVDIKELEKNIANDLILFEEFQDYLKKRRGNKL